MNQPQKISKFAKALLDQREIDPQDQSKICDILNHSAWEELMKIVVVKTNIEKEKIHKNAFKLIKESVELAPSLSGKDLENTCCSYYIYGCILYSMRIINSVNPEATYQNSLSCFEYCLKKLESGSSIDEEQSAAIKKCIIRVKSKIPSYLKIFSDFLGL